MIYTHTNTPVISYPGSNGMGLSINDVTRLCPILLPILFTKRQTPQICPHKVYNPIKPYFQF